jgi:DNA-binding NarL/FixJ family response regulator
MTSAVNVLLVETDAQELRERAEQLLMDGYAVDSVSVIDQAHAKLAEGPDALVLSGGPDTIGLLRELRAGEIPRTDSRLPVLVLGVDDDSAAVRYYRAGADVALPSESSGLLVAAGLETITRRAGPRETRILRVGSLSVDRDARTAQVDSRPVKLTRLEFDLLSTRTGCGRSSIRRARNRWCKPSAASAGGSPDDQHRPAPSCGWSRDSSRVSQVRAGWPQIQSRIPVGRVERAMISAMHELSDHVLADLSSATVGYRSAYGPFYTVVYTKTKEVW